MLAQIVLGSVLAGGGCPNGQCAVVASVPAPVVVSTPVTVVSAPVVVGSVQTPSETVISYKRNIFGRLVPVRAKSTFGGFKATASGQGCVGGCK